MSERSHRGLAFARRIWRVGFRARWRALRAPILLAIGVASIVLGTIGYLQLSSVSPRYGLLDSLYRSFTLFALGGTAVPPVPVTLQIARILAPLLTGYAAIGTVLALSRDQARVLGIRLFVRNHVIIAGLGATGSRLAAAIVDHVPVVVIDPAPSAERLISSRLRGIRTLGGSAADQAVLRRAGIANARTLVAVCGSSATNVDVAAAAAAVVSGRTQPLNIFAHLQSLDLWSSLAGEGATFEDRDADVRLEYFNVLATGAQLLLEREPPFHAGSDTPEHVLIVGTDGVGEQLVLQLARHWRSLHPEREQELRVTLAGRRAEDEVAALMARYPALEDYCQLDARALSVVSAAFQAGAAMAGPDDQCDVTRAYVSLADEGEALLVALALHARADAAHVPVTVAVADARAGVSTVLGSDRGRFGAIRAFGVRSAATSGDLLLRGTTELLARAQHAQWLAARSPPRPGEAENPYGKPWEELNDAQREHNRRFADDLHDKLALIGATLVPEPLPDLDGAAFAFSPDELERLSRHEHARWNASMLADGWRYGEPRDDGAKVHDQIKPWDELDEANREKDRAAVRELPRALALAGFAIQRRLAAAQAPAGTQR